MQLKLLNFYKFLSNFANKLVGAFIPIIIYNETKELYISFLYLMIVYVIRIIADYVFKKQIEKNPQIFLLFRIVTIIVMDIGILLLNSNIWLGVILSCIFVGLDETFKTMSNEIIYNYSSLGRNSKSLGITRVFEQLGMIASLLIGGFLLDISTSLVVLISLCLYSISVIPLIMYYIKNKRSSTFNKDAVSNAVIIKNKIEQKDKVTLGVCKKVLFYYMLLYFVFAAIDVFTTGYKLQYFIDLNSFSSIGMIAAVFAGMYGVGSYVAGILNSKYDIMWLVQISFLISSLFCILSGVYYSNVILAYISFALIGFLTPFMSVFVLQRLLNKTRIFGISNDGLFVRDMAGSANYVLIFAIGAICSATSNNSSLISYFMVIAAFMIFAIWLMPFIEERTRVIIVDYLQNNEITKGKFSEKVNRLKSTIIEEEDTKYEVSDSKNKNLTHNHDLNNNKKITKSQPVEEDDLIRNNKKLVNNHKKSSKREKVVNDAQITTSKKTNINNEKSSKNKSSKEKD